MLPLVPGDQLAEMIFRAFNLGRIGGQREIAARIFHVGEFFPDATERSFIWKSFFFPGQVFTSENS